MTQIKSQCAEIDALYSLIVFEFLCYKCHSLISNGRLNELSRITQLVRQGCLSRKIESKKVQNCTKQWHSWQEMESMNIDNTRSHIQQHILARLSETEDKNRRLPESWNCITVFATKVRLSKLLIFFVAHCERWKMRPVFARASRRPNASKKIEQDPKNNTARQEVTTLNIRHGADD